MFPSILNTFNRPATTDRLNSPSHSALHNTVSSALGQIEAVIGTNTGATASAVGTLFYDVRSPDSNGGGHIQTANKGGTGQTSYTKGDILVATSSSVLAKLAVSSTIGESLQIDTNTVTGMKWAAQAGASKVAVNVSSVFIGSVLNATTTIFAASILGSTLGTGNAVRFTGLIRDMAVDSSQSFVIAANYGNNVIASVVADPGAVSSFMGGVITGMIVGNGGVSSQLGYIHVNLMTKGVANNYIARGQEMNLVNQSTSSVESSANQNFTITTFINGGTANRVSVLTGLLVLEKIS